QNKVNQWTASIVEHTLTQLVKQGKPFKYIVNCAVMQKSGAGLHTANSCYWDTTTDVLAHPHEPEVAVDFISVK
uniref:Dynein light chain Tctex-type 3 n=1 Tax=Cyprinus carpio TaxID=7962 RepID=A0A8C1YVQ1_CYPCA